MPDADSWFLVTSPNSRKRTHFNIMQMVRARVHCCLRQRINILRLPPQGQPEEGSTILVPMPSEDIAAIRQSCSNSDARLVTILLIGCQVTSYAVNLHTTGASFS
jgi:hypothetical protein